MDEALTYLWIERARPTNWPSRSSELTTLDFSSWRYVSYKLYSTRVLHFTRLKKGVASAVRSISADVLQNVWRYPDQKLNEADRKNRGQIELL